MQQQRSHEQSHFFSAAKIVAGLTMLSRLLGMVRDVALLALGATRFTDAFWTAFRVPNTFRRLFGEGALAAAFVPVFTEVSETEGWQRARLVLANVSGLLALILAGIVVAGEVGLWVWMISLPASGGDELNNKALLAQLTMLVLPFMFTICMLALGSAALQCKGKFAYPAFAPILLNIFLIAGAAFVYISDLKESVTGFYILAATVLAAGITQLVGIIWLLRKVDLAVVPRLTPVLDETKRMGKLFLPMLIPLGVVQFSSFFDGIYAYFMTATEQIPNLEILGWSIAKPLESGVVTRLYGAERMYNFPLGILAISLATAVFPLLSRFAARNDVEGLRQTINRAMRLCVFMGIPAGVALMLLAGPGMVALFSRGKFTYTDATGAAYILRMYCLGMWAYFANHILLRAFYAQKDTRTPLRVSVVRALLNIALVVPLVFSPLKAGAFGFATALTSTLNVLVLTWILHCRLGEIGMRSIMATLGRTLLATTAMAAPMAGIAWWWSRQQRGWSESLWMTLLSVATGIVAFSAVAWLMRCKELRELLSRKA